MPKQKNDVADIREAMGNVADDVRELLAVTSDVAEDRVVAARKRVKAALDGARSTCGRLQENARAKAQVADKYVRENTYGAVGCALALGLIVGLLLRRSGGPDA
jgi:ElaB/YqjD/DUF883 family membrane-anchored ribosome-binding protein